MAVIMHVAVIALVARLAVVGMRVRMDMRPGPVAVVVDMRLMLAMRLGTAGLNDVEHDLGLTASANAAH